MARNRAVALVGAVLIVLVALPSLTWGNASGFLGETRGNENQLTEGLVSLAPSQGSWNGTVVATIPVGNSPIGVGYGCGNGYLFGRHHRWKCHSGLNNHPHEAVALVW